MNMIFIAVLNIIGIIAIGTEIIKGYIRICDKTSRDIWIYCEVIKDCVWDIKNIERYEGCYGKDCKSRKDEKRSTTDLANKNTTIMLSKEYAKAYRKNIAIYGDKEELYDFEGYKKKVNKGE